MIKLFRVVLAVAALGIGPVLAQTPAPAPSAAPAPAPAAKPARAARGTAKPAAMAGAKVDINGPPPPRGGRGRPPPRAPPRPYEELQDLVKKKVLSQGVFDKAKGGMALANINTSTAAEMAKTLPGIGDVRAKEIVAGRPYSSAQDLLTKKVLTEGTFDKVKDLVAW